MKIENTKTNDIVSTPTRADCECLLHLRRGSVSTLMSQRAAGQTARGFPAHTQNLQTLVVSD